MSTTETDAARARTGNGERCRPDVDRAERRRTLMRSWPDPSDATATPQWADVSGNYLERLANAVRPGPTGLAGAVSEGATAVATMIGCQLDPRRAVEVARRSVAERYRDLTGSELSAELVNRGLRSGGSVEEQRERLIDSDFDGR